MIPVPGRGEKLFFLLLNVYKGVNRDAFIA